MASASSPLSLHIANYLRLAQSDARDARTLLATKGRNAAYLTQQAAEKLLLALLTSEGIERSRSESHRLDVLVEKLPAANPLRPELASLGYLTAYATTFRYPKQGGRLPADPDWQRLEASLDQIDAALRNLADHFAVDLDASDREPAGRSAPPR